MKVLKERSEAVYVWKHIHLNRSRVLIFFTLLMLAFMLFVINVYPFAQMGLLMIPLSYGLGVYTYRKLIAWTMGAEGERRVISELSRLNDNYFVLNNIVLPPNWGDTDHIVLGPNGLFVVETKTSGDVIECDGDSWRRYKVSGKGFAYPVSIGNPSNQAKRNAKSLKDLVLKHEFDVFNGGAPHIWVHAIVCFTNEDVELKLKNPTVEVLRLPGVCNFIKSQKPRRRYSGDEVELMGTVILRECN